MQHASSSYMTKPLSQSIYPPSDHQMQVSLGHYRYPLTVATPPEHKQSIDMSPEARAASLGMHASAYSSHTPTHSSRNTTDLSPKVSLADHCTPNPPTTVVSSPLPADLSMSYSNIPKHWIWNSSLFYPHARSVHDGFLAYPNGFGAFMASSLRAEQAKTIDLSQQSSEGNSDDSLDGGKTSPSSSLVAGSTSSKKRNPYSIEELLKKPEKRIKIETLPCYHSLRTKEERSGHDSDNSCSEQSVKDGDLCDDDKNNDIVEVCE